MIREVCLFDKFSFCKNGVKCSRVHLKEVCLKRECDYRKCNKRHPRPCRFFRENGFCKFGTSCRYSHRVPKDIEENNKKIESLEEVTKKLSKQVADQDNEIKALKLELCQITNVELKGLKKEIDDLIESNNEKERAIKKLEVDFNEFVNDCGREEQDESNEDEEYVELQEKESNSDKKKETKHPVYVQDALECAENAYDNIKWTRKEPKLIVQGLSEDLSDIPCGVGQKPSKVYQKAVSEIKKFAKSRKEIFDEDYCLSQIVLFKQKLQTITL